MRLFLAVEQEGERIAEVIGVFSTQNLAAAAIRDHTKDQLKYVYAVHELRLDTVKEESR